MKTIKIGVLGFGTIGTGVIKTLQKQQALLQSRVGVRLEIKKIADLDISTPRDVTIDSALLTTDAYEILNDPEIEIVVELIGGYEPAKTFILQAIQQGKHVVTANKALLAVHGQEIFDAASRHHVASSEGSWVRAGGILSLSPDARWRAAMRRRALGGSFPHRHRDAETL